MDAMLLAAMMTAIGIGCRGLGRVTDRWGDEAPELGPFGREEGFDIPGEMTRHLKVEAPRRAVGDSRPAPAEGARECEPVVVPRFALPGRPHF